MLALGTIGGAALYVSHALEPMPQGVEKQIVIPKGMSPRQISNKLEQAGIIRDGRIFSYYLRYTHEGSHFKAGTYAFAPGITRNQIIQKLNNGDVVKAKTFRLTIPEGFTIEQMADKLAQMNITTRQAFIDAADHDSFSSPLLQYIPKDTKIKHRLEGYLFPDTYEFKMGSSNDQIIQRMLDETGKQFAQLPQGWQQQMKSLGINFHQMMTIASMIEREVVVDKERPLVASVIYNRLNKGMLLQIDATIEYALGKPKSRLYDKDTKIDDPFNTYKHKGLPPGPIASPGFKSIQAALYPAKTNYLYYVTKKDGSHEQYFSSTMAQHEHNIAKSKQAAAQ